MNIWILVICIVSTHFAFSQKKVEKHRVIPFSLMISGQPVNPNEIKFELWEASTNRILNANIEPGKSSKDGFYSISLTGIDTSMIVSIALRPTNLGYEIGKIKLDSILSATKISVEVDKIFFKEKLAMGLSWTNLHIIVQIKLYRDNSEADILFYSVKQRYWSKRIEKILKKAKTLKGEFTLDPDTKRTRLVISD